MTVMDTSSVESSPGPDSRSGPPTLPLSLRDHKKQIALEWTIILADSCVLPLVVFYVLWYGTDLSHATLFTISTCAFGFVSLIEYFLRLRRLLRKDPFMRPIGGRRRELDMFQHIFTIGTILVTVELVIGTIPDEPMVRLCAMPAPTTMFLVGGIILLTTGVHLLGLRLPFRVSSLPAGSYARPALYTVIEDVVAVDGRAGLPYRHALNARYEASPLFRRMLVRLSLFWSIGALVAAAIITAVIFVASREVAYGAGWGLPFIWAAAWTSVTFPYVQSCLAQEKAEWPYQTKDEP